MIDAYAVIATGGKQYLVKANDKIEIETLDAEVGASVELSAVLAVSDGKTLTVGCPVVPDAKVSLKVLDHVRGDKVVNFKKKRRKGYRRKIGHRQNLTVVEVEAIG